MAKVKLQLQGVDKQLLKLLLELGQSGIRFPKRKGIELDKKFFKKYSEEILEIPYSFYGRILNNMKKVSLDFNKLPEEVQWLHRDNYLLAKTYAMEGFMIELQRYCFGLGQFPQYYSVKKDLSRAIEAELLKFLGAKGRDAYRDHTLHKGHVFLYGLWLYTESGFIRAKYKEMLKNSPSVPGCIARIAPNDDIRWQFFQQWFITASYHDIGYILSQYTELGIAYRFIFALNRLQRYIIDKHYKGKMGYKFIYLKLKQLKRRLYLDIGSLYNIQYQQTGESHINPNFWNVCLKEIETLERGTSLDHGINSAKILLKLANFRVKNEEVDKLDPYKRYSYRNYLLPSLAIAKHNLDIGKNLISKVKKNKELEIMVKKNNFKEDFLTTLLVCCDELAEFERLGYKKVSIGMDFNLKLAEDNQNIVISLIPLT